MPLSHPRLKQPPQNGLHTPGNRFSEEEKSATERNSSFETSFSEINEPNISGREAPLPQRVNHLQRTNGAAARQRAFSQIQRSFGNKQAAALAGTLQNPTAQENAGAVSRAISDSAASSTIQRVPYATAYGVSKTKSLLNESEDRPSPVNAAAGHPRQHVGKWEKAERFAEEQGRTKSIYTNTAEQDKAIASALSSAAGQIELAKLDANPAVSSRVVIKDVNTDAAEVKVVKAKKKKGAAAGVVKNWAYQSGSASKATVIVDSMGTNKASDIHLQTAYPVYD